MSRPQRISVGNITRRGKAYRVRWRVGGKPVGDRSFRTRREAERFHRSLHNAADEGVRFDPTTGEPETWGRPSSVTAAEWARTWYVKRFKATTSGGTRKSDADMLVELVTQTLGQLPNRSPSASPSESSIRLAVRHVICRPPDVDIPTDLPEAIAVALDWIRKWSPVLADLTLNDAEDLWNRLGKRLDGRPNAVSVANRQRDLANRFFSDAVNEGHIRTNPMGTIKAPRRMATTAVNPNLIPRPHEALEIIKLVALKGDIGQRGAGYLTTILNTGGRPAEVSALTPPDICSPGRGRSTHSVSFTKGLAQSATRYTDDGERFDKRSLLKWRAEGDLRQVPITPAAFATIDNHMSEFGVEPDCLIFTTKSGEPIAGALSKPWNKVVRSYQDGKFAHLRPYDLRHVHATALIETRMPPNRIAERLGHSISELQRTYAHVFASLDANDVITLQTAFESPDGAD